MTQNIQKNREKEFDNGILSFSSNKNNITFKIKGKYTISVDFGQETKYINLNSKEFTLIEYNYGNTDKHIVSISNTDEITEIDISDNEISELNVENCNNLQKLFIYNNSISHLNLIGLENLQYIHMQNNPICKNKELMTQMISALPDRNNKAFGSIVMYDFVPPRNFESMTEEQRSIRELRKELEKTSIPKDWYFGSAIMYDEVEKNKVPNTVTMSNVVDIWESAEYGEGAVYASLYEMYVPDQTTEWNKDVFLAKYDITSTGEVVKSTQTDSNTSYDTGHGTSTNSILISQGNEMYGLIPKAKCAAIMRGNTFTDTQYFSKNVFETLMNMDKLDFIFTSSTFRTKDNFSDYESSIKNCLDKHKTLFFICASNRGDDNISTPDSYITTYHSHMVSGCSLDIDSENMSGLIDASNDNDDRIKFTANYFGTEVLKKNKGISSGSFGTSHSTPYMAGVFCLLKILYDKKHPDYTLEQLEKYTYNHAKPLHYNEDAVVGYGTLDCMYFEDKSTLVKADTIKKTVDTIDLSVNNKISSAIRLQPENTSNTDFRLACKLGDSDIIIDKGIIYPKKNDGSIVNKKLYSSSNLKLTETVNVKLPENKEFKEIEDGLIFSLSPKTGFTDNISGTKLTKNGSVNIVQKYFRFGQDGALILENFKVPEVITIQYLVDKVTNLEDNKIGYITYFKKSTNDKIKLISTIQKKTDMNCRYVYQAGTPIGNAICNPNVVEKNTNDLLDCMTFTIDFKTGRIIVYANGIITWGTQISNIPKLIDTTTKKPCYLDNLRNLLTMDTLIIGNNASFAKEAETLDIYDVRIFDRELTPTEVVQNTSALMCNAQIKEEENNMAIESKDLLVAIKAFSRANALPLDASSVHGSQELANTYAKQANAYGGQIITAKVGGKFKAFVLQGENGNCTIEPLGADPSTLKQYVIVGTRPESNQNQGVIYIDNNVGYIWDGEKWVKIFEDVSTSITDFQKRITKIESDINLKANIANANFTGTLKLEGKDLATKEYAESLVNAAKSEVPIVIDEDNSFPSDSYKAGQKYVVALEGTYLGQKCEIGDLILIVKDYNAQSHSNADGIVLQSNIDGAVTSSDASSIDGEIVVMSGATGKVIKSSKISMTTLNNAIAKVHEHANKAKLDTYNKTQTELLSEASQDAKSKVDALKTTVDGKADKATTITGYGITDAYNKTEIDAKLKTIQDNVNTKVDTDTVDSKVTTAKDEAIAEATRISAQSVQSRLDIPITKTVKQFVEEAVGAGGTDVSEQIQNALKEAKEYTDTCLTIVQF
ncbi:MAG: S8 family serine peptidase [Coprococcus sp.]